MILVRLRKRLLYYAITVGCTIKIKQHIIEVISFSVLLSSAGHSSKNTQFSSYKKYVYSLEHHFNKA